MHERFAPASRQSAICPSVPDSYAVMETAERQYEYMVACIKMKQFHQATAHYAIAGVQTWYDYLANPGAVSKERHQNELRKQLSRLSNSDKQHFWEALNSALRDEKRLRQLCKMLDITENTQRSKILWDEARNGYLHCTQDIGF